MKHPYVLCHPNKKKPIGNDWGNCTIDAATLAKRLANNPDLNVGIFLGPDTGIVDVECDGEAATAHYAELFGEVRTPSWSSTRGCHYLYSYDARLAELPNKVTLESGLEFRLGNGKQTQSIIPPSIVDGVRREWIIGMGECDPATLPEHVIELLLSRPREVKGEHRETSSERASEKLITQAQQYAAKLPGVKQGGRDNTAYANAGYLFSFVDEGTNARLNEQQLLSFLRIWNDKNDPPLSDSELQKCIGSAMKSKTPRPDKVVTKEVTLDDVLGDMSADATDQKNVSPKSIERYTFAQLRAEHPNLNPPVIDGLIREGETCNIISHTKVGKSWLGYGLLLSVVTGQPWLGFNTSAGDALLIDNELHKSTLSNRIESVADAMGIQGWQDHLHVWPLRGNLRPLHLLGLEKIEPGQFKLIVLDAMYRFNITGVSENDNAAMATFYNTLDRIADRTKAAIVVVHHTTKGNQSNKRVTDVGAGAGSQSRAADCHLIIREHEQEGVMVLDAAVRSFAPIQPVSLRWEFPLWLPDDADPTQLKTEPNRRQAANDVAGMNAIKTALTDGPATVSELRKRTNFGKDRVERLVGMMANNNIIGRREVMIQRRQCEQFHLAV